MLICCFLLKDVLPGTLAILVEDLFGYFSQPFLSLSLSTLPKLKQMYVLHDTMGVEMATSYLTLQYLTLLFQCIKLIVGNTCIILIGRYLHGNSLLILLV